jgi:isoleucyl-tRNA synthetase
MWRNLTLAGTRNQEPRTRESVHLADWPVADEALIDGELQDAVRLVQRLASLGRSARAKANLKVRQPLQKVYVKVQTPKERETVRALADQLIEELNVKEVAVIDDEAEYFDYQVRPNLPVLGPKLGARVGELQRALASADKVAVARAATAGRQVELDGFTLEPGELLVTTQGKPGYAAAEDAGYAAVVTTEITPELADEGLARELVRRIQEMRKDAGFDISDRIRLTYAGDPDIARVMQSWRGYISQETLAESVEASAPPGGAHSESHDVDGRKVTLAVLRT